MVSMKDNEGNEELADSSLPSLASVSTPPDVLGFISNIVNKRIGLCT